MTKCRPTASDGVVKDDSGDDEESKLRADDQTGEAEKGRVM